MPFKLELTLTSHAIQQAKSRAGWSEAMTQKAARRAFSSGRRPDPFWILPLIKPQHFVRRHGDFALLFGWRGSMDHKIHLVSVWGPYPSAEFKINERQFS